MRVKVDWRSSSKENYKNFCDKNSSIKIKFDDWRNIIYLFNEHFKNYILETGEKIKLPFGFGEFSINKKRRKKFKTINGEEIINLPIDWHKSKEKGKRIYNFNYHTEGYFFGWIWFKIHQE
jgi:nucleoid DNA-binding protein